MTDTSDTLETSQTGADLFIKSLECCGVTTVFGVPGEETTALMRAIEASDLTFVLTRHEQAAAFMASVHGRLTGRPAVCLATLGPGATNLITGVADAHLDHVPLIAVTGQGSTNRMGPESHQMIDLDALFAPVTKFSRTIVTSDAISGIAAEAVRRALAEKPGAVHVCLPEDIASAEVAGAPLPLPTPAKLMPSSTAIEAAARRLACAERPVILAGAGVLRGKAVETLQRFAESLQLPIATSFMANGVLPQGHPLSLYSFGQPEDDYVDLALQAADLVIAVGFDPVEYPLGTLSNGKQIPVLALSQTETASDTGWLLAGQVAGDLNATLEGLMTALEGRRWDLPSTFEATHAAMEKTLARRRTANGVGPMAPQDICSEITRQIRPEDTVLSGVGLHKLWVARHVIPKRAGQVIIPNGLAGMGLALPGAVAAARLNSEGRVLAICGDGDVMMNVQDMETAARLGLDLTVMVWEDGGYGLIDEKQADDADPETTAPSPTFSFNNSSWAQLATAFGWTHAPVDGLAALPEILRSAHAAAGPVLLSLPVDYTIAGGMPGVVKNAA